MPPLGAEAKAVSLLGAKALGPANVEAPAKSITMEGSGGGEWGKWI